MNIPITQDPNYQIMWVVLKNNPSTTLGLQGSREETLLLRTLSSTCKGWRLCIEEYCHNECQGKTLFVRMVQGHLSDMISSSVSCPRNEQDNVLASYADNINIVATMIDEINAGNSQALSLDKTGKEALSSLVFTIKMNEDNIPFCAKLLADLIRLRSNDIELCQFVVDQCSDMLHSERGKLVLAENIGENTFKADVKFIRDLPKSIESPKAANRNYKITIVFLLLALLWVYIKF